MFCVKCKVLLRATKGQGDLRFCPAVEQVSLTEVSLTEVSLTEVSLTEFVRSA